MECVDFHDRFFVRWVFWRRGVGFSGSVIFFVCVCSCSWFIIFGKRDIIEGVFADLGCSRLWVRIYVFCRGFISRRFFFSIGDGLFLRFRARVFVRVAVLSVLGAVDVRL